MACEARRPVRGPKGRLPPRGSMPAIPIQRDEGRAPSYLAASSIGSSGRSNTLRTCEATRSGFGSRSAPRRAQEFLGNHPAKKNVRSKVHLYYYQISKVKLRRIRKADHISEVTIIHYSL